MTKSIYDYVVPDDTWSYPIYTPFTVYLNDADRPLHTFIDRSNQVTRVIFERVGDPTKMRTFVFVPPEFDLPDECQYWLRREEWEGAAPAAYLYEITDAPEDFVLPEPPPPPPPIDIPAEEPPPAEEPLSE